MLKSLLLRNKRTIIAASVGAILGGASGFAYWKFVGCISGTCAIWSNPVRSTLYGALLGALLLLIFVPDTHKSKNPNT